VENLGGVITAPINAVSKEALSRNHILLMWATRSDQGLYVRDMGDLQAVQEKGAQVRKGESQHTLFLEVL